MIIEVKNGFKIKSHVTGKMYPKVYPTRQAAQKRIDQMEMFKNIKRK